MKCLGSPVLGDTLYAAADDAKREERAYLHSAALRIPAGCMHLSDDGAPIEVVCAPTIGSKFTSAAFASTWARWFSEAAEHQGASLGWTWFESTPVASARSASGLGARLGGERCVMPHAPRVIFRYSLCERNGRVCCPHVHLDQLLHQVKSSSFDLHTSSSSRTLGASVPYFRSQFIHYTAVLRRWR